jgi:hypothetical protein
MDGKNILIVLFSFFAEDKNEDGCALENLLLNEFKNKGLDKVLCDFNEIENPIKKRKMILCATFVLM